jgi:hypothetical protein
MLEHFLHYLMFHGGDHGTGWVMTSNRRRADVAADVVSAATSGDVSGVVLAG